MKWATVITDASFCHHTGKAGWAAWISADHLDYPVKRYGAFRGKLKTSQEAEAKAAINGIAIARSLGSDAVLLQTDCLQVVHLMDGTTKKRSAVAQWAQWWGAAKLHSFPVRAKHVKGHTRVQDARSHVNRWCDAHANRGRKSA